MIAVRIGRDFRNGGRRRAFLFRQTPETEAPQDLTAHDCINIRLPTYGSI